MFRRRGMLPGSLLLIVVTVASVPYFDNESFAREVTAPHQTLVFERPEQQDNRFIYEARILDLQAEPSFKGGRATQIIKVELERAVIGPERTGPVLLVLSFYPTPTASPETPLRRGLVSMKLRDEHPCLGPGYGHGVLGRDCKDEPREDIVAVLRPSYWSAGGRVSFAVTGSGSCAAREPVENAAWKGLPQICVSIEHLFLVDDQGMVIDEDP